MTWPSCTSTIGSPSVTSRTRRERKDAQLTATESNVIVEMTISVPVTDSSLWVMPC